ncbi:MAG: histidine kinase [Chitinophagaceae bacterium]
MNVLSKIKWLYPGICLILCIIQLAILHYVFGFLWVDAIKETTVFASLLILSGALLQWLLKAYTARLGKVLFAVAMGLLLGLCAGYFHFEIVSILLKDLPNGVNDFQKAILEIGPWIDYPYVLIIYALFTALYEQIEMLQRRYSRHQDTEALHKEAELFKLRQQLQPHFLYNSLNAISALIILEPNKAELMISRLSDFLRSSVKQGSSEQVSLEEELSFLKNYLWIETVRFGDRLQVEWNLDEAAMGAIMPPFLLQPVMENAIRFGVYGRSGTVIISVRITLEFGLLRITISNPFDPTMKAESGTGFGLSGIRRRLYLSYGRQDLFSTEGKDGYFFTTISIPQ